MVKRLGGCNECFMLAASTNVVEKQPDLPVGPTVTANCPFCDRQLIFPVGSEAMNHAGMIGLLKNYGTLVAKHRQIPATHFSFKLNGEDLFSDPPCGCPGDCEHAVLSISFEAGPSNNTQPPSDTGGDR